MAFYLLLAVFIGCAVLAWWCWDKYRNEGSDPHLFISGWLSACALSGVLDLLFK